MRPRSDAPRGRHPARSVRQKRRRPSDSPAYGTSLRGRLNRLRYAAVARFVDLQPHDRILDLGCGKGAKSIAAYNMTNPIVGVDLFPERRLRPHGPNFEYLRADARDLRMFDDQSFDVVVSFGLFEHLDEETARTVHAEAKRLGRRYVHLVPHRLGFIEPHFRLPFFALWPAVVKTLALRTLRPRRGRPPDRWRRVHWRSRGHLADLFDDPNLRLASCWYGPILMYQVIAGGGLAPVTVVGAEAGGGPTGSGLEPARVHRRAVTLGPVWISSLP